MAPKTPKNGDEPPQGDQAPIPEPLPPAVPSDAPPCDLEGVKASPDPISEEENAELTVSLSTESNIGCQDTVILDAPNFSTNSKERTVSISSGQKTKDIQWVLAPEDAGKLTIAADTHTGGERKTTNVVVKRTIDIPWPQLLSGAGTIFGPMLAIPYWLDKWRGRKSRREAGET